MEEKQKEKRLRTKWSKEEKLSLIRAYYMRNDSKRHFAKEDGLSNPQQIRRWTASFEKEEEGKEELSLQSEQAPHDKQKEHTETADKQKEELLGENKELTRRLKEIEKALAYSRLETKARAIMIDLA